MSNTAYKPLPTEDSDTGQVQQRVRRPQRPYNRKRALITHFATLAAVMVVTYFGVRWLVCLTPKLRNSKKCGICADTAHTPSSLPTHYTLPSGDKIPAVALGTVIIPSSISCIVENWLVDRRCLAGGRGRSRSGCADGAQDGLQAH